MILDLIAEIEKRITQFRSANDHGCGFWVERLYWEEVHSMAFVRDRNRIALFNALDALNEYAAPDQLDDLYRRILDKAWDAALCDWREDPLGKPIDRARFLSWFRKMIDCIPAPYEDLGQG